MSGEIAESGPSLPLLVPAGGEFPPGLEIGPVCAGMNPVCPAFNELRRSLGAAGPCRPWNQEVAINSVSAVPAFAELRFPVNAPSAGLLDVRFSPEAEPTGTPGKPRLLFVSTG